MRPYTFSKEDEIREEKWNNYKSIFNKYIDHYHNELLKNPISTDAKNYLKRRRLTLEEVKKFKIGFETNDINFQDKIFKKFKENEIRDSGLFYFDEKKKKYISRFRERILFPIRNITGDTIAIGGRILKDSDYLAKYINSPETPFFKKGSNLFNLDFARKLSNNLNNVFLVEGYMDVIGLSKNNVENVVANLGTALTDKQITILNSILII